MLITYDSIQDPDSVESKALVKYVRDVMKRTIPDAKLLDRDEAESIGLFTFYKCLRKRSFDLSKKRDRGLLILIMKRRCIERVRIQLGRKGKKKKERLLTNKIHVQGPYLDPVYGADAQYRGGFIAKPKRGGVLDEQIEVEEGRQWSGITQGFWDAISEIDPEIDPRIVQVMILYLQKGCYLRDAAREIGLTPSKFSGLVTKAVSLGHLKHNFRNIHTLNG